MNNHIKEFFSHFGANDEGPTGHFHEVIVLHERPEMKWEEVRAKLPELPRGWFELSHLTPEDRVGFTAEYWISKFPFYPNLNDSLLNFFKSLDDIGVYITQKKYDDPYDAVMVYSIKEDGGFYCGALPATYNDCMSLQSEFPDHIFPQDYFAFLQIHNGFRKTIDSTGILSTQEVPEVYKKFQQLLSQGEGILTCNEEAVAPSSLIPFYESFGLPFFQCFWEEWHQELGMGNVYCSVNEKIISDYGRGEPGSESLAFPTFSEWLVFYLESIQ